MDRLMDAVNSFEAMTAGRYYNLKQKERLVKLLCKAYFLSGQDAKTLRDLEFNSDFEHYKTVADCANGLLLFFALDSTEYVEELLNSRREELLRINNETLWRDRLSWLNYVHTAAADGHSTFERATYYYATEKSDEARNSFALMADNCHILSIRVSAAIAAENRDASARTYYLARLQTVFEQLLGEELPSSERSALKRLSADNRSAYDKAVATKTFFYDEDAGNAMQFELRRQKND